MDPHLRMGTGCQRDQLRDERVGEGTGVEAESIPVASDFINPASVMKPPY